jgi:hypothetical protein
MLFKNNGIQNALFAFIVDRHSEIPRFIWKMVSLIVRKVRVDILWPIKYIFLDWNLLFTTKCTSCKFPIEAGDRWIEAIGSSFHSNCFNCYVRLFSYLIKSDLIIGLSGQFGGTEFLC